MRHPFFRFDIKNSRGSFRIFIGCDWDQGRKCLYTSADKTPFTMARGEFGTAREAQKALAATKEFINNRYGTNKSNTNRNGN